MSKQSDPRRRFRSTQDWFNFVNEHPNGLNGDDLKSLRVACYEDIQKERGRPLIVYFSKLDPPSGSQNAIDLQDIDGFADLVNAVEDSDSVDILINSPGGRADATERIVTILRSRFKEIHFIVPHSAYSAATMLALSGNTISLHPSATLGPIDPQINGIPARSIKRGFEKVKQIIKDEGPEALPAYLPLIEKYSLDLLEICDDNEKLSRELVQSWLKEYMFRDENDKAEQIEKAVAYFSNYDLHLIHSRPITLNKLKEFGLKVNIVDDPLRTLIREAYILINGFMTVSPFYKLYENTKDISWGKQVHLNIQQPQPQRPPRPQPAKEGLQ